MGRRRVLAAIAGVLTTGLLLAGCGSTEPTPRPEGAAPVTITHGQGTVTIPAPPQRVVVVGQADAQIAAALHAPVVGAARNPSNPDGRWLGVSPALPPDVYTLDSLRPNLEAIAALRPDLILMTTAQPTFAAAYEQISRIAPTISYRHKLLQDSGEELVRMIGKALRKEAEAAELIRRADAQVRQFTAEHPQLAGKRYAFGQFAGGTTYLVVAKDGPAAQWFGKLGLHQPDSIANLPIWQAGMAQLSSEQLSVLGDVDLAFISMPSPSDEAAFRAQPLVASSALVREGRLYRVPQSMAALLLTPNPASTPALLDAMRQLLQRGNP